MPNRPGPGAAPAASLTRFVLLIAAVIATSGLIFISDYVRLPGRADRLSTTIDACVAAQDADAGPADEVSRRVQACMNPIIVDWATFVGGGLVLLFGLAAAAYLLHPSWIVRRRRLRRLTVDGQPGLVGDLDRLRRQMGLARSPDWRLAPYARTTGGQAFGLPWHRYVQIDAGLAVLRVTRPAEFRAVVLHELAHLRNRDVDKTYFAISTWRAFVAVALLPYLVFMLHPGLLSAPLDWRWAEVAFVANPGGATHRLASLVLLTATVYLTRNAILRVRETHADATAAAADGPDSALPTVLGRMPEPPAWRRWGTHPHPRQRLDAIRDPGRLLGAGFWELAGVGIATGGVCANLGLLAGSIILVDSRLAVAVVGLVTGAVAAGLLAAAIWRATARDPSAVPSWRTWLLFPLAVVTGYSAGAVLTLREATGAAITLPAPTTWLVATSVLAIGAVFLAAWATSATRGVLRRPDSPRWTMPAVVAVTVLVGAVWFAVWLPPAQLEAGFADGWGAVPVAGAEIGWYAWVARVTGADYGPLIWLVANPLTLAGLTLMWLVPVLAGLGRRSPVPVRPALIAGLVGAAGLAVAAIALPYAARLALPEPVRTATDEDGVPFATVYDNTVLAMASIAVAVVMTVMAARRGPHRPVSALLAAGLTTVLATAVVSYLADPIACYVNVTAACGDGVPVRRLGARAHFIALQAILVAVPAMLVAAGVRRLTTSLRDAAPADAAPADSAPADSAPADGAPARGRLAVVATAATLGVLVVLLVSLSVLMLPAAYRLWLERTFG